jgi:CRP-like cAMP-binding protein
MLEGAPERSAARGETLYLAGDDLRAVVVVLEGRVKLVVTSPSGAESIVGIRGAGEILGDLAALAHASVHETAAIAIDAVKVATVTLERFYAAAAATPESGREAARTAARRLGAAVLDLAELAGKSVAGRLVDALGRLGERHGELQPDGTMRIGINLTHKDLADLIGTARETVTKELGVLSEIGLVRVTHKTVTLVQPRAFPYALRERATSAS